MTNAKNFHTNGNQSRKLDRVHKVSNQYANAKIDQTLDAIEAVIRDNDGKHTWDRAKAKEVIGQHIALAHALGYMDRTDNVEAKRIILTENYK